MEGENLEQSTECNVDIAVAGQSENKQRVLSAKLKKFASKSLLKAKEKIDLITSTQMFKDGVKEVFKSVDMDKSGTIDQKELYIAILLFYCKLASMVKGLVPPKKKDIDIIMKKYNIAEDEGLNLEQFTEVMTIVLGNITSRVLLQLGIFFLLIPIFSTLFILLYRWLYNPHWVMNFLISSGLVTTMLSTLISTFLTPFILQFANYWFGIVDDIEDKEKTS